MTYEFVMVYGGARQSQSVLVDADGISVAFNTYRVEVRGQVTDANGAKTPVLTGTWWYIAPDGGWHNLGTPDAKGDALTQLLPGTYTFVHVAEDGTRHEFKDVTIAQVRPTGSEVRRLILHSPTKGSPLPQLGRGDPCVRQRERLSWTPGECVNPPPVDHARRGWRSVGVRP